MSKAYRWAAAVVTAVALMPSAHAQQTAGYIQKYNGTAVVNTATPIFEDATNSRIGIGTISPQTRLHVDGGELSISHSLGGTLTLDPWGNGELMAGIVLDAPTAMALEMRNGASGGSILIANGKVGIGNSFPSYTLDVGGTGRFSNDLHIQSSVTTDPRGVSIDQVSLDPSASLLSLRKARGTLNLPTAVLGGDILGELRFNGHDGTSFSGAQATIRGVAAQGWSTTAHAAYLTLLTTPLNSTTQLERMRIDTTGNVGIGTASPNSLLHIAGSGTVRPRVHSTSSASSADALWEFWTEATTPTRLGWVGWKSSESLPQGVHLWNSAASNLIFGTNSTERLRIASAGNVGIGTTGPAYLLDVNGQMRTTNDKPLKPTGGSWVGYSDRRLKRDIRPIASALDTLAKLQGVQFEWIHAEGHDARLDAGFIAQDVEKVFPAWVTEVEPSRADKKLVPAGAKVKALGLPAAFDGYVVEAIKELRDRNLRVEQELSSLKSPTLVSGLAAPIRPRRAAAAVGRWFSLAC